MNKKIKAKWVKALRSGEYKQGKGRLRRDDKFCCLGVLCDIFHKETGKGGWDDDAFKGETMNVSGVPPKTVIDWAELSANNPQVSEKYRLKNDNDKGYTTLATLNDSGRRFKTIASIIETEL